MAIGPIRAPGSGGLQPAMPLSAVAPAGAVSGIPASPGVPCDPLQATAKNACRLNRRQGYKRAGDTAPIYWQETCQSIECVISVNDHVLGISRPQELYP